MSKFSPERLQTHGQETTVSWSRRDTMLYALGLGADELRFVYECNLVALPTMAVVLGYPGFSFWSDPELGVDTKRLLHGETEVIVHGPLPTEGEFVGLNKVVGIWDKGAEKGAIVRQQRRLLDASGRHLATINNTTILRRNGGFGGSTEPQPEAAPIPSHREPDEIVDLATSASQALLYRLAMT